MALGADTGEAALSVDTLPTSAQQGIPLALIDVCKGDAHVRPSTRVRGRGHVDELKKKRISNSSTQKGKVSMQIYK